MTNLNKTNSTSIFGIRFTKPVILMAGAIFQGAVVLVILAMMVVASQAASTQADSDNGTQFARKGAGEVQVAHWKGGHKGRRHGGRGWFFGGSDGDVEERVTKMIKHMAIEIDATPEQESRIIEIVTPVAVKTNEARESMRDARRDLRDLMTADTVDQEALEELRSGQIASMDQISRDWLNAFVQVSEILTEEQREEIEDYFDSFRGWRGRR